jgi:uncharacterized protein with GYD domain
MEGEAMAKYLLKARFSAEGLGGVMKEGGSARRKVAEELAAAVGGSLECYYFAFGEDDAFVICDLPDNQAAAKVAMTVSATGRVSVTTIPLLTVDQVDEIAAGSRLEYTPPGV